MNEGCLSKRHCVLKTKDGKEIKMGMRLYWWWYEMGERICEFKVQSWHDGKWTQLHLLKGSRLGNQPPCYTSISGYGGAGVYPEKEENCFSFFLAKQCWFDLQKLISHRNRYYEKLAKMKPKVFKVSTRRDAYRIR